MTTSYLLPTDGSEPARQAEDFLIRMADPDQSTVYVLGVCDSSVVLEGYEFTSEERSEILDTERVIEELRLKTEQMTAACQDRLEEVGFEVETRVVNGRPGVEICSMAEDRDVDSIVMGRRGAGTLTEVLMGSVSSYVVHHTDTPVTLVPNST